MNYPVASALAKPESSPRHGSESDRSTEILSAPNKTNSHSLAMLWARKYVNAVVTHKNREQQKLASQATELDSLDSLDSKEGRSNTVDKLVHQLTSASAQAWSLTEELLSDEIPRHGISPHLINPWEIAADSHTLFQKTLTAYAKGITPQRLSVIVGGEFGQVRQKYTAVDPRIIGFVSMQFHYTGQKLLEKLSLSERSLLMPYLKVMDDHLYMPLRQAYEAAANYDLESPVLNAVQHLLPMSTAIANAVCDRICQLYPIYESYSGSLQSSVVRTASIRDVEMFQVYLCLCVLENDIRSVQNELFPLCVMLYPQLRVSWKLVQEMLQTLKWEIHDRLEFEDLTVFLPYLHLFMELFSPEVFPA